MGEDWAAQNAADSLLEKLRAAMGVDFNVI